MVPSLHDTRLAEPCDAASPGSALCATLSHSRWDTLTATADASQPKLFHKTFLKRELCSLDASSGCGRIRADDVDVEFAERAPKLSEPICGGGFLYVFVCSRCPFAWRSGKRA